MDKIELKLGNIDDLNFAMEFINQAKKYLKSQCIDQWQKGYPDEISIKNDLENQKGYFLSCDSNFIGYLCIDFDGEPAYDNLNGEWLNKNQKYVVVHRMAISNDYRGKGIASIAFNLVEELAKSKGVFSFKVDTDEDNSKMKHILSKNGFQYCGTIWFDNSVKIAYEKIL